MSVCWCLRVLLYVHSRHRKNRKTENQKIGGYKDRQTTMIKRQKIERQVVIQIKNYDLSLYVSVLEGNCIFEYKNIEKIERQKIERQVVIWIDRQL